MIEINLKYGPGSLQFTIPKTNFIGSLQPKAAEKVSDPVHEVRRALQNPLGCDRLADLVTQSDQVIILASDITRPALSHILIPPLLDELNNAGVTDENIGIIFGLGTHRKQTEEEMIGLVGETVFKRLVCIDHDIDDCREIGITSRGTVVAINRRVLDADFVIATGNLELHYFAGYSGGAKALAPGVCSRETIRANHQYSRQKESVSGRIVGNPVREDIEEIGNIVGIDFIVNAVLNSNREIVRVFAGHVEAAHRSGAACINDIYCRQFNELADIVIVSPGGYPKDIDLYQTHKAVENASQAVKQGGIIIVAAQCRQGIGNDKFAAGLTDGSSLEELMAELQEHFILGRHKAVRLARIQKKNAIYLVSDLPVEISGKMFLRTFKSIPTALKQAFDVQGNASRVLVMPFGTSTLPYFSNNRINI